MDGVSLMEKWRNLQETCNKRWERLEVMQLSLALKNHFSLLFKTLLSQGSESSQPFVFTYIGDGWSAFIWKTECQVVGVTRVFTCARERREFNLQRGILKTERGGELLSRMLFELPRPLMDGKTTFNMFTCFNDFFHP